jgi:hypothetical protein
MASTVREHLNGKRVICLGIPDGCEFMQPELVKLLEVKVAPFLKVAGGIATQCGHPIWKLKEQKKSREIVNFRNIFQAVNLSANVIPNFSTFGYTVAAWPHQ